MPKFNFILDTPMPITGVNWELLKQQLAAAFGSRYHDCNQCAENVRGYFKGEQQAVDLGLFKSVVSKHDANVLSDAQKTEKMKQEAISALQSDPLFVEFIAQANSITDIETAKQAIIALAQEVSRLRLLHIP